MIRLFLLNSWLNTNLGVIIVLLRCGEGQPSDNWTLVLYAVGFLAKVTSVTLIIPISEAIGQLKWVWFQGKNSKDAYDFEIFDKASRGPWGSLLLLFRTKGKSLAALGAFLTILLLMIDMFFSEMYQTPDLWVHTGESFVPRVIRYQPSREKILNSLEGSSSTLMNGDLASALNPFFFDQNGNYTSTNPNNTQFKTPQFCRTSRCEWSPYETLGVCSACADVSNLLEYACLNTSMDWTRSAQLVNTYDWPNGKLQMTKYT